MKRRQKNLKLIGKKDKENLQPVVGVANNISARSPKVSWAIFPGEEGLWFKPRAISGGQGYKMLHPSLKINAIYHTANTAITGWFVEKISRN